jgi:hypothetical protein
MQFISEEEGGRSSCKPVLGYPVSNPFNLAILKQDKYLRSYPSATCTHRIMIILLVWDPLSTTMLPEMLQKLVMT